MPKFYSKDDSNSHQTRPEKKGFPRTGTLYNASLCLPLLMSYSGEECTGKNRQHHARSGKCKRDRHRAASYVM